jgi:cyclase
LRAAGAVPRACAKALGRRDGWRWPRGGSKYNWRQTGTGTLAMNRQLNDFRRAFALAGILAALALSTASAAVASSGSGRQRVAITDGVYQFISPDIDGIEVDGNSIVIVNENDVLVFDTNVLPSSAQGVLREIRTLTQKPVRYVVNSHWHPDHWDGNEVYAHTFPQVEIIASATTRRLMQNTMHIYVQTLEFEAQDMHRQFDAQLKTGKGADGAPLTAAARQEIAETRAAERAFMSEYRSMHPVLPTLTFEDRLTLFHGGREFRFLRLPGHTAGDVALYLPREKVLITGDLLIAPVPFLASAHPRQWIESLKTLERLDADVIIPGHGPAQHDKAYLRLLMESLQSVVDQVDQAVQRGLSLADTQKFVKLDEIRVRFTHNDPQLDAEFQGNFAPIVRQTYDEETEELELYQTGG